MSRSEYEANEALFEACEHRHDTTNPDAAYRTPCATCTRLAFRQNHKPAKAPTWWLSPALAVTLGLLLAGVLLGSV